MKTRELSIIASVRNSEVLGILESFRGRTVKDASRGRVGIIDETGNAVLVSLIVAILLLSVALNV